MRGFHGSCGRQDYGKRCAYDRSSWVCMPKDFLDPGNRMVVDQVLSRFVKSGRLRRVGRDLYDRPRFSPVLNQSAPVDLNVVVDTLQRRYRIQITPNGLQAVNQLDAVPARSCKRLTVCAARFFSRRNRIRQSTAIAFQIDQGRAQKIVRQRTRAGILTMTLPVLQIS